MSRVHRMTVGHDEAVIAFLLFCLEIYQAEDVGRDPLRLVFGEQLGRRSPARLILEYTEVWPGVCLSIALVSSECLRCVLSGRDYDEAKSNKDCQFLFIFLAVGLCAGPCTGAATGGDRTTVTPVYVCA